MVFDKVVTRFVYGGLIVRILKKSRFLETVYYAEHAVHNQEDIVDLKAQQAGILQMQTMLTPWLKGEAILKQHRSRCLLICVRLCAERIWEQAQGE